jgi:hypothetical protein
MYFEFLVVVFERFKKNNLKFENESSDFLKNINLDIDSKYLNQII